jgi:ankyrin repeat protein
MPEYADSVLQAAIHNKSRVVEAHLSTVTSDEAQRMRMIKEVDEFYRNAFFYASAYGNLDSLELLAAADIDVHITDKFHRTSLHYAALNDNSKVIETVFMANKSSGKNVWFFG